MQQTRYEFKFTNREIKEEKIPEQEETVLDLSYLDKVVEGAEHLRLELISIFITIGTKEYKDIEYWHEEREWKALCFSFHKIRSNLRMMGFLWLAHKAGEYEKWCTKLEHLEVIDKEIEWFLSELKNAVLQAEMFLEKNQ